MAFNSYASNLVPGDTNKRDDVFVRDVHTGRTERVSVSSSGRQADDRSFLSSISAYGRFVAFWSRATNLVPHDSNRCQEVDMLGHGCSDVFVHDRQTHRTTRASVTSNEGQANHASYGGSLSSDGRYVAFSSVASNLVPSDTNTTYPCRDSDDMHPMPCSDVFVRDRVAGTTRRVSISSMGSEADGSCGAGSLSGDGRYVAFACNASNLVQGDTNAKTDVFIHDLVTGETTSPSIQLTSDREGSSASIPTISADGRIVAYWFDRQTQEPANQDVIIFDRRSGENNRVPNPDEKTNAGSPQISSDGRSVCYSFLENPTRILVRDLLSGTTEAISVSSSGRAANGLSESCSTSGDGRYVAFTSSASNLVANDTNVRVDVFLRDRRGKETALVSLS